MSAEDREDNDPLQFLIAEILEAENRGETVDRQGLVDQHPEHAESLRDFFASHDRMKSAAEVDPPTLPPSESSLDDPTIPPSALAREDATLLPTEPALRSVEDAPVIGDKVRYFGDYELLEEIARGGMGVVYKARQMNLNRVVALKMILAGQFAGQEDVQRFYTEAEAAASLDHPGIVPIFEIGEYADQHYFSMGYIEGESLAQRVADGPLPPREAAELVKKICDAMAYAHDRGVIHRDLKPANILIDANGQPKVTDFGLAKKTKADSGLTGTGQILGTPAYMPPEQASGKNNVGSLADVYSLGAILYCLLTGRPPFQAASPMDTLLQVLDQEPVAPRVLNTQVPRDLDTICLKSLNKESNRRYESADTLAADLRRYLSGEPIVARPTTPAERAWKWCKRNPRAVATASFVAILLIAFGIVMSVQQRKNVAQQAQTTVASLNTTRGVILPPLAILDDFPRGLMDSELKSQFEVATDRKLPLAYALAHYSDVRVGFLLSRVNDAPPDEAGNFVDALRHAKPEAMEAISTAASLLQESDTSTLRHKARLAMLGLHLGDPTLVIEMCQLRPDPIQRTVFIDECSSWCVELVQLSKVASEIEDAPARSAICLAVGGVPTEDVTIEQREAWQRLLTDWHRRESDACTHSASGWTLRQWSLPLAELPIGNPERSDSDDFVSQRSVANREGVPDWRINRTGLTMLRIPTGQVLSEKGKPVEVTEDFLLSDREITVGLFRQFMDDRDYPAAEKPKDWRGVSGTASPTDEHPAQNVSWYDAVMFCNWLSHREGLAPCYKRTGQKEKGFQGKETPYDAWRLDVSANGYRLPTEAEWEYACRAGTTTTFSFGDAAAWLDAYGVARADRAEACGARLPNGWGLFDMHGNVSEWCDDGEGTGGSLEVLLGGNWSFTAKGCGSSDRHRGSPTNRVTSDGFRVAVVPFSRARKEQESGRRQTDQAIPSEDTADAIVDRAIHALGGVEKLSGVDGFRWKAEGKISIGKFDSDVELELVVQGLDKLRYVVSTRGARIITVLKKDDGWMKVGDNVVPLADNTLAKWKRDSYLQVIPITLVALKGENFLLGAATETSVGDTAADAVQVQGPDAKTFEIYFDKETGLPIKLSAEVAGPVGETALLETTFGAYKEFDGLKIATRISRRKDGRTSMELTVTEFELQQEVDPELFNR